VIRELGHGGMGRVFLAERVDGAYEQRVALKLTRSGSGNPQVLRERFLFERQVLARLQHPNIARLLDGGVTDDGTPYIVMEHVAGEVITTWADARCLSLRARLELFLATADAVHYANRNLIVHRDLKPSNILVTEDGAVRLLDFGVAKLLEEIATGSTPETMTGMLMITPEYAAPEQIDGGDVSFATDVYALGVVLYELLTGRLPVEITRRSIQDLLRTSRIEAPAPSATVATHSAERSTEVARQRKTDPPALARQLRGDLDAIVLKALRKEPERRYVHAGEMAEDVERFLGGYPVRARPDSRSYRARKFVRRHAVLVGASGLLAVSLLAGAVATLWQARAAVH
jgi:serine/threonine-protein kinase